jgi:hypothetical protein
MSKKPCVFIQTNEKQLIGALVSAYSLKRNSATPDAFDVQIMHQEDHPFFRAREGQIYLRDGVERPWQNEDLQSFTLTRFMPPELMGYEGRALVIDPDVFAVGDAMELLRRDMEGKAILCRLQGGRKKYSTSVMLLDCAKLKHWQVERDFSALFERKRDYIDWTSLALEPEATIGLFGPEWNDFDRLTPETKLIHNTKRRTQPWKTGLKVDFFPVDRVKYFQPWVWLMAARRKLFGTYGLLGYYQPHPDPNQERFFFTLLKECLDQGIITPALLEEHMRAEYIRHDALDVVRKLGKTEPKPIAA